MGRATTEEQAERDGKWWTYAGFRKSLELYNLDQVILEEQASDQAKDTGHVLVVEGPFDVARLYAAGIRNVVATLGTSLSSAQIRRLHLIGETTGVSRFLFFYDRDRAGRAGAEKALQAIAASGLELQAESFNWDQTWESPYRGEVGIPASVIGPSEFSLGQLQWLRHEGLI
jgi:5S rRNA maturation endonuclease (ribonuclease M5)